MLINFNVYIIMNYCGKIKCHKHDLEKLSVLPLNVCTVIVLKSSTNFH